MDGKLEYTGIRRPDWETRVSILSQESSIPIIDHGTRVDRQLRANPEIARLFWVERSARSTFNYLIDLHHVNYRNLMIFTIRSSFLTR